MVRFVHWEHLFYLVFFFVLFAMQWQILHHSLQDRSKCNMVLYSRFLCNYYGFQQNEKCRHLYIFSNLRTRNELHFKNYMDYGRFTNCNVYTHRLLYLRFFSVCWTFILCGASLMENSKIEKKICNLLYR